MFDKTKKNFNRLKNEGIFAWKLISGVFSVWFDIVILAYYILANVFALGNRIINIIMLSLSILILIVDIFYWSKDKRKRKKIKKEYKETKKLLFYAKIWYFITFSLTLIFGHNQATFYKKITKKFIFVIDIFY